MHDKRSPDILDTYSSNIERAFRNIADDFGAINCKALENANVQSQVLQYASAWNYTKRDDTEFMKMTKDER